LKNVNGLTNVRLVRATMEKNDKKGGKMITFSTDDCHSGGTKWVVQGVEPGGVRNDNIENEIVHSRSRRCEKEVERGVRQAEESGGERGEGGDGGRDV